MSFRVESCARSSGICDRLSLPDAGLQLKNTLRSLLAAGAGHERDPGSWQCAVFNPKAAWTGSGQSRFWYAIANAVICKGDNGRWQPNYSAIIGGLAAGGISNLYYPAANRNGASLTFENALIGIGGAAASNVIQEFIVRRFTPHLPPPEPAKP